jgi:hypothetical protein
MAMTETLEKAPHDIERQKLQNRLASIDRDPEKLQNFIAELFTTSAENPQIFYAAATHLTSLTYLDRRDENNRPQLPDQHDAARAFASYTRLIAMLGQEKDSPLYANNARVRRRSAGTREELGFHAPLAYARAMGADFVALPSPAGLDFSGARGASDLQVFFPTGATPDQEIQVKFDPEENGNTYEPHIAVFNLSIALDDSTKAVTLRGLLKDIGSRNDESNGEIKLTRREHDIIMEGSAAILQTATNWPTT